MSASDGVLTQASTSALPRAPQRAVAAVGVAVLLAGALVLGADGWERGVFLVLGGLLGLTLYHAAFGFTSAYRRAFAARDISGVGAQLVMLALATVLFAPVLAQGQALGHAVVGAVAPVAVPVAIGSAMFGLGMQLAGGCGSGTLYTVGGGSVRMVLTLAAFCLGGFWATLHFGFWAELPSLGSISLAESFGWEVALPMQLAALAAIWLALRRWARGAQQRPLWQGPWDWRRLAGGPWPLLLGGISLAVLNWATLVIAGHPWTITWAFTLWGAKAATVLGWDPGASAFWTGGFPANALAGGILDDTTSVMDIGIMVGALAAAGLAGRFAPVWRIPWRSAAAALAGGLLMGYGARLAYGCNIGAFFSGVASTSLHGWLWIVCALMGVWIGVRLRPLFGLEVERPTGSA